MFGTKFKLSVDIIQLFKVIGVWNLPYVSVINCLWNGKSICKTYT